MAKYGFHGHFFFSREKKHCVAVSTYLWEKKSQISFEEKMYAWVWGYQIYTQLPTTFLRSAFFTLIWKGREICDKSLTYWRETYCLFHRFLQHSESSPSKIFKQLLLKMSCNAISPPPLFLSPKTAPGEGRGGLGGGRRLIIKLTGYRSFQPCGFQEDNILRVSGITFDRR